MKLVMKLLGETLFATPYFLGSCHLLSFPKITQFICKYVRSLLACTCISSCLHHDTRSPEDYDQHAHWSKTVQLGSPQICNLTLINQAQIKDCNKTLYYPTDAQICNS